MKNNQTKNLSNKIVLVTASLRRIGREIVIALAKEGATIAGHYRTGSEADLEALKKEVESLGGKIVFFNADISREAECTKLMESIYSEFGSLDFLINNASIFPSGTVCEMDYMDLEENIKINSWAPFILSKLFYSRADGGAIVNLLDTKVKDYDLKHASYYLSKRMLADITHLTALDFAPNFRVNAVAPGLILPPVGTSEDYLEELKSSLPLNKYGDKEQVADAVLFLLKNDFITGQVIYVDGGAHLKGGF